MGKEEAVDEAVKWAIKENLLDGFFRKQKAEVTGMSLTELTKKNSRECAGKTATKTEYMTRP
ncbi:MAG: hypothetical protein IIT73_03360 [Treponema sp.]|nr:hypothetical protein [Treponema sp.]